jgi:hypothetical protein
LKEREERGRKPCANSRIFKYILMERNKSSYFLFVIFGFVHLIIRERFKRLKL